MKRKIRCAICKELMGRDYFGRHLSLCHPAVSPETYYLDWLKKPQTICSCGKPAGFLGPFTGYRKFCSVSCQSSHFNSRPHIRKQTSERIKNMMAQPHMKDALRARNVQLNKRIWSDPILRAKHSKRVSDQNRAIWATDPKKFAGAGYGTSGRYKSKKAGLVHYRSTWERLAYRILDEASNVTAFCVEPGRIPYLDDDGVEHSYIPDIVFRRNDGTRCIVEVKPAFKLTQRDTILKAKAARRFCRKHGMTYQIWDGTFLDHYRRILDEARS